MIAITIRMKCLKTATLIILLAVMTALMILAILSINKSADKYKAVITNNDRIAYLSDCGREVIGEEYTVCDIIIPYEFNNIYTKYNELQKSQGFNLSQYKGVTAQKYTYNIKNDFDSIDNLTANMLIYNDRVIGGDISSSEYNGITESLKK